MDIVLLKFIFFKNVLLNLSLKGRALSIQSQKSLVFIRKKEFFFITRKRVRRPVNITKIVVVKTMQMNLAESKVLDGNTKLNYIYKR